MSNNVKIFRAKGYFRKNKKNITFQTEIRALKLEHGLEKLYSEIGSRHRVKRTEIFLEKEEGIVEINPEEAKFLISTQIDEPDFAIKTKY